VQFDLAALDWRHPSYPVQAVISCLAIHHLDAQSKQQLFHDIHQLLVSGGIRDCRYYCTRARGCCRCESLGYCCVNVVTVTTDAFAMFEREKWNMYRYGDPEGDQPSSITEQLRWLGR